MDHDWIGGALFMSYALVTWTLTLALLWDA